MDRKETLSLITAGIALLTLKELSQLTFEAEVRNETYLRDKTCQFLDCQSSDDLVIHHLVPECLANGRYNHHPNNSSGEYVDFYQALKTDLVKNFSPGEILDFNRRLKPLLNSLLNALTVCRPHHLQLHRDKLILSQVNLKPHHLHPQRPENFSCQELEKFLIHTLLPLMPSQ